jgi:ABC-type polysaccharide/polyol phosphate export permease
MPSTLKKYQYDSSLSTSRIWEEFKDIFNYRDLLSLMISDSLKTRYKKSFLGVIWTLLNPLLTMTVLTIVFSTVFRFALPNYAVYLLSGLTIWNLFAQSTAMAMTTILSGGNLLKKIYLPRTIFSIATVGAELVNLLISLVPLALIMLFLGHPFRLALLFLPLAILIVALFSLGIALLISTLGLFFSDWVHIYQILISTCFYITPIFYPIDIVPKDLAVFINYNPLYYLVNLFRMPIYQGMVPDPLTIAVSLLSALLVFLLGWWIFSRQADEFAYRI